MKNFIWKVKQFLIGIFDNSAKWWCPNCGLLPSYYNSTMGEKNPHYCPQCKTKIIDYDEELPFAEPDVTDKDFRKSIVDKFCVTDFNSCPKCGINDKNRIGFNTNLFYDYIETFKKYRRVSIFCHECKYQTHQYKDFEGCLKEWNDSICGDMKNVSTKI